MKDIQKRALESIDTRIGNIAYNYENFSNSHKAKVYKQLEVLNYIRDLVEKDMEERCQE